MTSRQKQGIFLVLLIGSPWLLCQIWITLGAPDEAITSMPKCSKTSEKCAHLGGKDTYRMDGKYTLIVNKPIDEVRDEIQRFIADTDSKVLFEKKGESDNFYIHFVERTSFWRFPDDVSILLSPLDGGSSSSIELHSQSRLGKSDLGANPKRLKTIYSLLGGGIGERG